MFDNVYWLGHAGIQIKGSLTIYVDPYQIAVHDEADIILITHDHYDHLSLKDIQKIEKEETVIVAPRGVAPHLPGHIERFEPGQAKTIQGVFIQSVPAYNIDKIFHPEDGYGVGYLFQLDGITYYHAGDSDAITEMNSICADVVFLPVGGTYTMTAEEAAHVADKINPKLAIPIHWGNVVGSYVDAEDFEKHCMCPVRIMKPKIV